MGLGWEDTKHKVQVEERKDRHPPVVQKPRVLCSSQVPLQGRKGVASGDSCSCIHLCGTALGSGAKRER